MNAERYTITIFEEDGVMHFHSASDWGDYRKEKGLAPGVAVECDEKDVKRWAAGFGLYARTQYELREILNKAKNER